MKLHVTDAKYVIEALRLRTECLIDVIEQEIENFEQVDSFKTEVQVEPDTYTKNLESLVKELTKENAALAEAANTHPIPAPKKRTRKAEVEAPWGYKKDGTPKQRPGRKV